MTRLLRAAALTAMTCVLTGTAALADDPPSPPPPPLPAPPVVAPMPAPPGTTAPVLPPASGPIDAHPGNLYIVRDYAEPTLWTVNFLVDGKVAVGLRQKSYTALTLSPGVHQLEVRWPALAGQIGKSFSVTIAPGQTSYLQIIGQYEFRGRSYWEHGGAAVLRGPQGPALVNSCCKFTSPHKGF